MKQIYKAVDWVDDREAYFMLDDANKKYVVISADVCDSDEEAVEYLKSEDYTFWPDSNSAPRRADMIDPVLLAEW